MKPSKRSDDFDILNTLEPGLRARLRRMDSEVMRQETRRALEEARQVFSETRQLAELNRQSEELRALLGSVALDYIAQGNGKDGFSVHAFRSLVSSPALSSNLILAEFVRSYYCPSLFARLTHYISTRGYNLHNVFFPSLTHHNKSIKPGRKE